MHTSTKPADPPAIICKAACFSKDGFVSSEFFFMLVILTIDVQQKTANNSTTQFANRQ